MNKQDLNWKIYRAERSRGEIESIFLKRGYKIKRQTLNMYSMHLFQLLDTLSHHFISSLFLRKPLISCIEKQLLGEHMTAMLQKGTSERKTDECFTLTCDCVWQRTLCLWSLLCNYIVELCHSVVFFICFALHCKVSLLNKSCAVVFAALNLNHSGLLCCGCDYNLLEHTD